MYGSGVGTLVQSMVGQTNYGLSGVCLASKDWSCDNEPQYLMTGNYSSIQWEGIDLTADFSVVVKNANAVVSEILQQWGNISIAGQNSTTKSCVIVRWPWMALPLTIVLLGMLTLGLMVWETHRSDAPSWKSSLPSVDLPVQARQRRQPSTTGTPSSWTGHHTARRNVSKGLRSTVRCGQQA